jgi:ribosomal protein S18 acetylase RimI-like enzyme
MSGWNASTATTEMTSKSPPPRAALATAADLAVIVSLTEAAYDPYTRLFGAPPLPVTEDYAPRIAASQVWLLWVEDVPAGLLVLECQKDYALIFSVAVAPGQQGRGYGSYLLDFADREARRAGLPEIRLYTNVRMERNITLYAAHGYRETGRRENPYRPSWILVDMAKRLAAGDPDAALQ